MIQTAIPVQFENYLQQQISAGKVPDMNQVIFAYLPDLDTDIAIDLTMGLPDSEYWVHTQDIDQVGKLNGNALAYSVVIPSAISFTFNAIYLQDKNVTNSCGMVIHKVNETKESGTTSTKTLVHEYSRASEIANITVDASTWQIDYQARLFGIEEDHRLGCLDNYGHTAFVEGFNVTQQGEANEYTISPGLVYIGGLRGTLDIDRNLTIDSTSSTIYIEIHREGTVLSNWVNVLTITTTEIALADYIDINGNPHYVAKLVDITADGVVDSRESGVIEVLDDKLNTLQEQLDALVNQVIKERVSVGEIIEITGDSNNPAELKGYGEWRSFGAGLVMVGVGGYADSRGEGKIWGDGSTTGEYSHVQTVEELAIHEHDFSGTTEENTQSTEITVTKSSVGTDTGEAQSVANNTFVAVDLKHNHEFSGTTEQAGSAEAMNNIQPTIAVYRWLRTK